MTTPGPRVKTPAGDAPVIPVILLGTGMYLAWFGIHYWRSDVKWPTDPVKDILQGKGLPPATKTPTSDQQAILNLFASTETGGKVIPNTGQFSGPALAGGVETGTAGQNKQIGKMLATGYGWGSGADWDALDKLWTSESGWSNTADTRKSGLDPANATVFAYGIPQSRPYSKMPKAAWPPDKGGRADPTAQIQWGLAYIKQNYGSPSKALAFKYGAGGGKGY